MKRIFVRSCALFLGAVLLISNSSMPAHKMQPFYRADLLFDTIDKAQIKSSREDSSYKNELIKLLQEVQDLARQLKQDRAPRYDAPHYGAQNLPVPPQPAIDMTAIIKEICCCLKEILGDIDHDADWESLIDGIACTHIDNPDLPKTFSDALALLADALTETLARIGCPEECGDFPPDVLGRLCYIRGLLIEIIGIVESNATCCESVLEKVYQMNEEILGIATCCEAVFDVVESNATCCESVLEIVKGLSFSETCCESVLDIVREIDITTNNNATCCESVLEKVYQMNEEILGIATCCEAVFDVVESNATCCESVLEIVKGLSFSETCCESVLDIVREIDITTNNNATCCESVLEKVYLMNEEILGIATCCEAVFDTVNNNATCCESVLEIVLGLERENSCCESVYDVVTNIDAVVNNIEITVNNNATCCEAVLSIVEGLEEANSCCESVYDVVTAIDETVNNIDITTTSILNVVEGNATCCEAVLSIVEGLEEANSCCESVYDVVTAIDETVNIIDTTTTSILNVVEGNATCCEAVLSIVEGLEEANSCCEAVYDVVTAIDETVNIIDTTTTSILNVVEGNATCCEAVLSIVEGLEEANSCCESVYDVVTAIDETVNNIDITTTSILNVVEGNATCCEAVLSIVEGLEEANSCCESVYDVVTAIDETVNNIDITTTSILNVVEGNATCCEAVLSIVEGLEEANSCCESVYDVVTAIDETVNNIDITTTSILNVVEGNATCCEAVLSIVEGLEEANSCCESVYDVVTAIDETVNNIDITTTSILNVVEGNATCCEAVLSIVEGLEEANSCCESVYDVVTAIDETVNNIDITTTSILNVVEGNATCCEAVLSIVEGLEEANSCCESVYDVVTAIDETVNNIDITTTSILNVVEGNATCCEAVLSIVEGLEEANSCCESVYEVVTAIDETVNIIDTTTSSILNVVEGNATCCEAVLEVVQGLQDDSCCELVYDAVTNIDVNVTQILNIVEGNATCCESVFEIVQDLGCCPRTQITAPGTINSAGSYCLGNDIITGTITVGASNVSIDMNGYHITGGANGIFINSGLDNIRIHNGIIEPASYSGIYAENDSNLYVYDLKVAGADAGITFVNCSESTIRDVESEGNTTGILLESGSSNVLVQRCSVFASSSAGIKIDGSSNNCVMECKVSGTSGTGNVYAYHVAGTGSNNQFIECSAQNTKQIGGALSEQVVGFYVEPGQDSAIISQCKVNNTMVDPSTYDAEAYGIRLGFNESDFDTFATKQYGSPTNINAVDWAITGEYIAIAGVAATGKTPPAGVSHAHVYRVDRDTPGLQLIASADANLNLESKAGDCVAWRPDALYLAVAVLDNPNGDMVVYSFNPAGFLTEIDVDNSGGLNDARCVKWSYDGRYIALGGRKAAANSSHLYIFSFDPTASSPLSTALATDAKVSGDTVISASWHPSAYYLAAVYVQGHEVRIYKFDPNVSTLYEVGYADQDTVDPNVIRWSPDGKYVAVGGPAYSGSEVNIYAFDPDAAPALALSLFASAAIGQTIYAASWSPDGRYLVVAGVQSGGTTTPLVYKFEPADTGNELTLISATPYPPYCDTANGISWSPDGELIAVVGNECSANIQLINALEYPSNCLVFDNTVKGTRGGTRGIGIEGQNVIFNAVGQNVAFANDLNYGYGIFNFQQTATLNGNVSLELYG